MTKKIKGSQILTSLGKKQIKKLSKYLKKVEGIAPFAVDDQLCIACQEISEANFSYQESVEDPKVEKD